MTWEINKSKIVVAVHVLLCITFVLHSSALGVGPFLQNSSGLLSIEAEHYFSNVPMSGKNWVANSSRGYSGDGAMVTTPNTGTSKNTGYSTTSPHMDYQVKFVRTGTHYIWTRGIGPSGTDDTYHIGLDGVENTNCDRIEGFGTSWTWSRSTLDDANATFNVSSAGEHTLNVWMREDGFIIDKIVITSDANYTPSGSGPAESSRYAVNNPPAAVISGTPANGQIPLNVSFSGSSSTDPDGDALTYSWNFGDGTTGSGVSASHTFSTAGVYTVTLTVADGKGGTSNASMSIDAYAGNNGYFLQSSDASGLLSIEAEHYHSNVAKGGQSWIANNTSGYSGNGAMVTSPNSGSSINTGYAANSPRMDYQVKFVRTGTYYIWTRGNGPSGNDDSYNVGLDGVEISSCDRINGFGTSWTWSKGTLDASPATCNVATTGLHTLNVWMREDGFIIDKIVITSDANYTPTGTGPAESPRSGENRAPVATISAYPTSGSVPLVVSFDAGNSTDADGNVLTYSWQFGDGTSGTGATVSHTYTTIGNFTATLTVNDGNGGSDNETITITTLAFVEHSPDDLRLSSYALYGIQSVVIKDRIVYSGGAAVGSSGSVEIGHDVTIGGDIVSGGNAILRTRSTVNGNVTLSGTLTREDSVGISGTVSEGSSVSTPTLSQLYITPGTNAITVGQGQTQTLAPGIYGDLNVLQNGVLRLSNGNYVFKNFYISNDADAVLSATMQDQIRIDVAGEFELADRAEMKFEGFSYAPAVRIHCNDPNMLRIGCDVKVAGIITAPLASVVMYSRTLCDGAIYAREIIIEPDVVIATSMVNPEADPDGDGVPTGIEVMPEFRTDPANPADYPAVAIPHPFLIDNTKEDTVWNDFGYFFDIYPEQGAIPFIYPAGSLKNPLIPFVLSSNNQPSDGIPEFTNSEYVPEGQYIRIIGELNENQSVIAGIPIQKGTAPGDFLIAIWNPDSLKWKIFQTDIVPQSVDYGDWEFINSKCAVAAVLSENATDLILVKKKHSQTVIYYDNNANYSTADRSELKLNITIRAVTLSNPANAGTIDITYTDLSDQSLQNGKVVTKNAALTFANGVVSCTKTPFKVEGDFKLTSYKITISTTPNTVVQKTTENTVKNGEKLTIFADCVIGSINADETFSLSSSTNLVFESMPLGGDGLIKKPGSDYTYNYFLKDHLGSTRMVLDNNGDILQTMMYQPYGTISDVDGFVNGTQDPLRKKFTGKEFDQDGIAYGELSLYARFENFGNDVSETSFDVNYTDGSTDQLPLHIEYRYPGAPAYVSQLLQLPEGKTIDNIHVFAKNLNGTVTLDYTADNIDHVITANNRETIEWIQPVSALQAHAAAAIAYSTTEIEGLASGMGLFYFGKRYYDAEIGKWTSVDPVPQYYDMYSYCGGNPINRFDPDGASAYTKAAKVIYKVAKTGDAASAFADNIQDAATLVNPAATPFQKVVAGASLLSELLPVSVSDVKDVGRVFKSWSAARKHYWKNRAGSAADGEFSPDNLARMTKGNAPRHDELNVPKELHHLDPQRAGGGHDPSNLKEVWPWEHADIDPFRKYTGPRPGE